MDSTHLSRFLHNLVFADLNSLFVVFLDPLSEGIFKSSAPDPGFPAPDARDMVRIFLILVIIDRVIRRVGSLRLSVHSPFRKLLHSSTLTHQGKHIFTGSWIITHLYPLERVTGALILLSWGWKMFRNRWAALRELLETVLRCHVVVTLHKFLRLHLPWIYEFLLVLNLFGLSHWLITCPRRFVLIVVILRIISEFLKSFLLLHGSFQLNRSDYSGQSVQLVFDRKLHRILHINLFDFSQCFQQNWRNLVEHCLTVPRQLSSFGLLALRPWW